MDHSGEYKFVSIIVKAVKFPHLIRFVLCQAVLFQLTPPEQIESLQSIHSQAGASTSSNVSRSRGGTHAAGQTARYSSSTLDIEHIGWHCTNQITHPGRLRLTHDL